ncbi:hypothetical protein Tco_0647095, partial [Tanacetum coccineum]
INLVSEYESKPSEAPHSPEYAPPSPAYAHDSPEYAPPSDDDLEPAEAHALSTLVESSAATTTRQSGSVFARGAIDRLVVALELTDKRVADLGTRYRQDNHEMYGSFVPGAVTAYHEAAYARNAWSFAMDKIRVLQRQRKKSDDKLTRTMAHTRRSVTNQIPNNEGGVNQTVLVQLVTQRVADALAAMKANRSSTQEETNITATTTRTCSYKEFRISKVEDGDRVKYAACIMMDDALTWWNTYTRTVQKMETKLWNLKVKGINIVAYTQGFQELVLLFQEMVTPETRMIKRYIGGLSQNINENVTSSKPENIHETITMAHSLMDQVIQDLGEKTVDNKRKWEGNHNNNNNNNSNNNYNQNKCRNIAAFKTGHSTLLRIFPVMAISVILISSDSSEDSVGTPAGQVILFGTIPTTIPDTTPVITPPATQTDTPIQSLIHLRDPSSDHIPPLPAISPFLSSDDDTTNSDTPDTPPSPTHGTPFTEITASTQRSPIIPHHRVMILLPRQPVPYGRPYHYHLNGPVHMMTTRKRVGPLPTHHLAVRHFADHSSLDPSSEASSDFHSDALSDPSSRHSLSDHSLPDLPGTSAGLSRKRRRSPMTSVPALSPISEALSPVRVDLIPSPKRVKDSGYLADVEVDPREISLRDDAIVRVSDEPHLEQDINPEIQAEIDECIAYADALRDKGIDARVVVEAID